MSLQSQVTLLAARVGAEITRLRTDVGTQDKTKALRTWFTALSGAGTAPADVLLVGASLEEGLGATTYANRWVQVFRDELRRLNQPAGIEGGWNYFGFAPYASLNFTDSPTVSITGTVNGVSDRGLGLRALGVYAGASVTLSFYGTGYDIVYDTDAAFGTFTYAVDGGAATSVVTNTATTFGSRIQIRNLPLGQHTLVLAVASGQNVCALEGVYVYNGDENAGIRVFEGGHAGYGAKDYAATSLWGQSIQAWNCPALCVIDLNLNDWGAGRSKAQFKADLQTVIATVKARASALSKPVPSFILMGLYENTIGSPTVPYTDYIAAIQEIATADDAVCWLDHTKWFNPDVATTRGGLMSSDTIHPSDAGYMLIGSSMARFCSPDGLGRMRSLLDTNSRQVITGAKTFTSGRTLIASADGSGSVTGEPYSDVKPQGPVRLYKVGSAISQRLVGANIYDLLLSDNYSTGVRRLTTAEVTTRLDAAIAMGANTVRTHAWISLGQTDSLMPTLGNYNEAAFVALDRIMVEARKRNLWLMVPVVDMWNYYHGGAITWGRLIDGTTNNTDDYYRNVFFTNTTAITAFKNYLTTVLTRRNTINGIRYVDDPTLAIIETINEGYSAPLAWTTQILAHLRSIAPQALLADGANALQSRHPDGSNTAGYSNIGYNSLTVDCDIVGGHFYNDRSGGYLDQDAAMAAAAGKAYIVGEWGWNDTQQSAATVVIGGLTRAQFAARMEANPNVSGDMFWSIHTNPTNNVHDDGYQLFYPPQNDEQRRGMDELTKHAWNMRNRFGRQWLAPIVLTAYGDTFDGTAALSAAKWINGTYGTGASASSVSNALNLVSGTAGSYSGNANIASLAPMRLNRRVRFDVTPGSTTTEAYFRTILRAQTNGLTSVDNVLYSYYFEISNAGNYNVSKRVNGASTVIGPAAGAAAIPGWAANVSQTIEFETIGTTINVRIWLTSGTRPAAPTWSTTDQTPSLQAPGFTGIALGNGSSTTSTTWKVDNYVVSDYPDADSDAATIFDPGMLLMRRNGVVSEPYSDANPPESLNMTVSGGYTPPNAATGQIVLYSTDGTALLFKDAAGTVRTVGAPGPTVPVSQEFTTTLPATPATGVTLFTKRRGRVLPAFIGPRGHDVTLQVHLGLNKMSRWTPQAASTTVNYDTLAGTVTSNGGTAATAVTPASGSMLSQCIRTRYTSTTTAGTTGSIRGAALPYFLSTTANMGGFHMILRFGFGNVVPATGTRFFAGMYSTNGAILASGDPTALLNIVGVGWNAADTPAFYLINNDGSGTATKTALGVTATLNELYELQLYSPPGGGGQVDYAFRALGAGTLVQGSLTTDIPALNTLLTPHLDIANGSLAAAHSFDLVAMSCETDN